MKFIERNGLSRFNIVVLLFITTIITPFVLGLYECLGGLLMIGDLSFKLLYFVLPLTIGLILSTIVMIIISMFNLKERKNILRWNLGILLYLTMHILFFSFQNYPNYKLFTYGLRTRITLSADWLEISDWFEEQRLDLFDTKFYNRSYARCLWPEDISLPNKLIKLDPDNVYINKQRTSKELELSWDYKFGSYGIKINSMINMMPVNTELYFVLPITQKVWVWHKLGQA